MKVLSHHVRESRKGRCNQVLHTALAEHHPQIEARLAKHRIDYVVRAQGDGCIHVFLGADECVEAIRRIGKSRLGDYTPGDSTPEEDFMLGIMFGYDRLAQCRKYLIRREGREKPNLPEGRRPGLWLDAAPVAAPAARRMGFTLIELLIVLGILGALASLLLSNYAVNRRETLDNSIVQSELAEIQRSFQAFRADCVLHKNTTYDDYALLARYGLAVLIKYNAYLASGENWSFSNTGDQGDKFWRGPYIEREGDRAIDRDAIGQPTGSWTVPVLLTPYSTDTDFSHYYRVVATIRNETTGKEEVATPAAVANLGPEDEELIQLWVLSPEGGSIPTAGTDIATFDNKFRRRLLLDRE